MMPGKARPRLISIHALREEGDKIIVQHFVENLLFLSTPSARRATNLPLYAFLSRFNFYPRPPRGGRPSHVCVTLWQKIFLSTPSARRATSSYLSCFPLISISIHALREEGDSYQQGLERFWTRFLSTPSARRATRSAGRDRSGYHNFYPRPPRGGRPLTNGYSQPFLQFLSTPSARRATLA